MDSFVPINDLSRRFRQLRSDYRAAFEAVVDSGWAVHGPEHEAFEKELATYCAATYALGLASGTDALELAMRAGMPSGKDTVLVQANAGCYSTVAARRAGYRVVFADVDRDRACLTAESVEAALTDRVGVVVVTHLYGWLTEIAEIANLTRAAGATFVEDCAQAIGARTNLGQPAGSLGDIGCFSFYPTKNLGAMGDGGAITTSRGDLADTIRSLRQYGWGAKYRVDHAGGVNSRLDEVQAAILRVGLARVDDWNDRRRAIMGHYQESAPSLRWLFSPTSDHVGHLAVFVALDRQLAREHLHERGVRTDIHYPVPDHRQPALAPAFGDISLPATDYLCDHVLTVPCFPELSDAEVERVCHALASL